MSLMGSALARAAARRAGRRVRLETVAGGLHRLAAAAILKETGPATFGAFAAGVEGGVVEDVVVKAFKILHGAPPDL